MSLSRHLQSADLLAQLPVLSPNQLRAEILSRGRAWLSSHSNETAIIGANLVRFGVTPEPALVARIQEHVLLHYFEKLLSLCGSPATFADYLRSHVRPDPETVAFVNDNRSSGRGILLATSHFGGVELIAPAVMMQGLPITGVLRFATEEFSRVITQRARQFEESGLFSAARFIEIGKPGVAAALEMAAVLRRRETLIAVFDEDTGYSVDVSLMGARVRGGAGLDRLLRFVNTDVTTATAFMVRQGDGDYVLQIRPVSTNTVGGMYERLEELLSDHLEQWYFLHEEIPFVA